MIDQSSRLLLTLQESNNKILVSKGKYETAKIKVKNSWKENESVVELDKMKTIRPPKYSTPTKSVRLGYSFIEGALNLDKKGKSHRPDKPKGKYSFLRFKLWENWMRMGTEAKLKAVCEIYANDQQCELVSLEII